MRMIYGPRPLTILSGSPFPNSLKMINSADAPLLALRAVTPLAWR